ncbi:grpE protein homolog 2, mitochondrial-like [Humulus lupulus]|uniref:grpE protein homolog 2, mitochondrial-like n=1 Tax=Humulus lupulus TaxID=3486 RepID=UPI002B4101E5|nr:grpE protein homolog 2, mitochondrial-like [Humulus lupulus]
MLTAIDADGGLPASPRLRFNKEGSLLAVTTNDNGIKILANNDGLRLIRMLESRAMDKNRGPSEPINSKNFAKSLLDVADKLGRASSVVKESFSKIDTSKDSSGAAPLLKTLLEGVEMT